MEKSLRSSILKMRSEPKFLPLIVILGPTAVGKTALSLSLAENFNGEIVSADSRLFYRGMDIGTAKPNEEEMLRVPHHLIDVAEVDEVWSLGKFRRHAIRVIDEIQSRGKVPFLVGGTGQFIRAIIQGWTVPEIPADDRLRGVLNSWAAEIGPEGLYERLKVVDPVATDKILPRNVRRTIRALEVIFRTGRRFSEMRRREPVPYDILQIGLNRPRPELDERIGLRVDAMIADGFVEEVARLLESGLSLDHSSMSAIGYRQIGAYLQGSTSLEEAVEETKKVTRKFYRRQMTWFKRKDPEIHWFDMGKQPLVQIKDLVEEFLTAGSQEFIDIG
jgi:tRNA dimethylallyltransferase